MFNCQALNIKSFGKKVLNEIKLICTSPQLSNSKRTLPPTLKVCVRSTLKINNKAKYKQANTLKIQSTFSSFKQVGSRL